jgi:hypothetical protein
MGIGMRGMLAGNAIGEMGPAAPLEGDLAEDLLLLEGVLPLEPGSIPAFLAGEGVTFYCDRIRRSHLRVSGGHPHGDYTAFGRTGKWTCTQTFGKIALLGEFKYTGPDTKPARRCKHEQSIQRRANRRSDA